MKKFIKGVLSVSALTSCALACIFLLKIVWWQKEVARHFEIPKGTEVVCIGNSHTGCSWFESAEFRNRVLWKSATGFMWHYLRFRELERRGSLDAGVKVVVMDCCGPAMGGFNKMSMKKRFLDNLPFAWRYMRLIPIPMQDLLMEIVCNMNHRYSISEVPPDEVADWTTRTEEEKQSNIINQYGKEVRVWNADEFVDDWQNIYLKLLGDVKLRCEHHGVRFICFAAPLTTQSPARANPMVWDRESMMLEKVKEMGCELYDYRTSCPDNWFRDSHHLLKSSSHKFTKKFYENILEYKFDSKH